MQSGDKKKEFRKTKKPLSYPSFLKWFVPLVLTFLCLGFVIAPWKKNDEYSHLPDKPDFNYHIRPILSSNCYICHGPDSSSREANLRLDNLADATSELEDGGRAIVPGDADESLLLERVSSHDPDMQMPPPKMKKVLSKDEIELLRRWIDQGAEWKTHWSFIAPAKPKLPGKIRKSSPAEIIDFLVDKKLITKDIMPSAEASKESLARRVSFLVTGLPPSPEEVAGFLSDTLEGDYERYVDMKLNSPHFGERWARHWMDLVRYAESLGHEFDYNVGGAHHYRDYLIRAFNGDVPYDQLVKEHLAGDMLEHPRINKELGLNESVIGPAFFYMAEGKHSPVSIKQEEADRHDNMIDVTSKAFQAMTVGCARCHDHKFDPIPTTDYYSMYGMLESSRFTQQSIVDPAEYQEIISMLEQHQSGIRKGLAEQVIQMADKIPEEKPLITAIEIPGGEVSDNDSSSHTVFGDFRQGSFDGWYTSGYAFGDGPVTGAIYLDSNICEIRDILPSVASSKRYGLGINGALRSPNFVIEEDYLLFRAAGKNAVIRAIIDNFQLIQNPIYGDISKTVNSEGMRTFRMDVKMWKGHKCYIEIMPGGFDRHQYYLPKDAWIDAEYAIAYSGTPPEMNVSYPEVSDIKKAARDWGDGKANPAEIQAIRNFLNRHDSGLSLDPVWRSVQNLRDVNELAYQPEYVTSFIDGEEIFSPVFIRGKVGQYSEEKVPHRFLDAMHTDTTYTQKGSGRLAWAEAVVSPDNPLTSRVMVNRIWHYLFGRGIVASVDNFGLQGDLPTHPELLDYLAIQFVEEGRSLKKMIRHIVMTDAFRRSTTAGLQNTEKDPQNLLLHHFPILRMEAEGIRDGILAVAGCMDSTMYGPPVPVHLTPFMSGRGRPYRTGPLDGEGRRSVYMAIRRNFLSPMMLVFDMPVPFSTFGKRNVTNVPAQSLTLMNDPFVQEQAWYWAESILSEEGMNTEGRIAAIYHEAFSREPSQEEILQAQEFLMAQAETYGCNWEEHQNEVQVWADYCHTIFNLKEFIHLL